MNSKEKVQAVLNHKDTEGIAIDFGATPVTGIHALAIENIRKHYGLKPKLVKIVEPYQMLGEVDEELMEIFGVDVVGYGLRKICLVLSRMTLKSSKPIGDKWFLCQVI